MTNHADPSRRTFLAQTAAVVGAGAVLPTIATASRRAKTPGKDEQIRIGIIGPGGMGTAHCQSILTLVENGHEDVQIVALADVCDSRSEHAGGVCQELQGSTPDIYRDHQELLARDDIHGVLIASPEHWHSRHAIAAIQAGKDVYLEKPMTLNLADAMDLRKVVSANPGVVFQVGTQKIMLPKFREAKKMLDADMIGHPTFSQTSYCRNNPDGEWNYYHIDESWEPGKNIDWKTWCEPVGQIDWDPKVYARWRRYKAWSTGIIGDLLVHEITPLIMALERAGWPTRVQATGGHFLDKAMENHDQVNINVSFENDHTMIVAGSTCNEVGFETLIRGQKGNMYLNGRHCVMRPERAFVDEIDEVTVECPDIGNDQDQLRLNWFRCMRSREKPDSNVDLGTKVMVIVDLATRSMWTGKTYDFDHKTMTARAV